MLMSIVVFKVRHVGIIRLLTVGGRYDRSAVRAVLHYFDRFDRKLTVNGYSFEKAALGAVYMEAS